MKENINCTEIHEQDASATFYRQLLACLDLGVVVTNKKNKIIYANDECELIFNESSGSLIGKNITSFFSLEAQGSFSGNSSRTMHWQIIILNKKECMVRESLSDPLNMNNRLFYLLPTADIDCYIPRLDFSNGLQEGFVAILNSINDGIYITDEVGTTLFVNKVAERTGGLDAEHLVGRNMADLVAEGYCSESASIEVIKTGRSVNIIQNLPMDDTTLLVSGAPYYKDGKLKMVITTERDITEIKRLQKQVERTKKITEKYQSELEYFRAQNKLFDEVVAESEEIKSLIELAVNVAKIDTTVFIQGESGVGKEVFAKIIHNNSARSEEPFIKVNCAAIPESLIESELFGYEKGAFTGASTEGKMGLFELANKGTLFLDEIGELQINLQAKLLRVLQEKEIIRIGGKSPRPVDVRIITATNRHLKEEIKKGNFRLDLFYRINVVSIDVPPLRERKEDIPALTRYFIKKFNRKYNLNKEINPEAYRLLSSYDWPGNIRELENILERVMITSNDNIISLRQIMRQLSDIGDNIVVDPKKSKSLKAEMEKYEKQVIMATMPFCKNTLELSKALGVDRATIDRKLNKHKIKNIYDHKNKK